MPSSRPIGHSALLTPSGWESPASVPLEDRGFRYGMHFFETLFHREGSWEDWSAHCETLQYYGNKAGFQIFPEAWKVLETPPLPPVSPARARLFWTAGLGSPISPPASGSIFLSIESLAHTPPPPPLRVTSYPFALPPNPFPGKTGNYWPRLAVWNHARAAGFDEALIFNSEGLWTGFCAGNGFALLDGDWLTPSLETGARRGVTRSKILTAQPSIREASLSRSEISRATALAFSSSLHGLRPVSHLESSFLSPALPLPLKD